MSHRAQQVIDAMTVNLLAAGTLGNVFVNRSLSLSEGNQEVPCVSVNYGDDLPLNELGASNISFLDSLIEVTVTAFNAATDEQTLLDTLLDQRRTIHVALMADRSQGLSFVIDTRYGGAVKPEVGSDAERTFGSLATTWRVYYRMNISDPS